MSSQSTTTVQNTVIEEIQAIVRQSERLLPRGGGSKPALSTPPEGVDSLDVSGLSGILEYQPSEFTFTALAGTPLTQVNQALAEHGQHLPFDPLLVERGATLGGTVAAGANGPGRYHYGGVRDFILGVRYVNGKGELVRGGGKVVKNAAGFDLPKLMVGSRGELGVLVEVSFKVFPKPEAYATLRLDFSNVVYSTALEQALQVMHLAGAARLEIDAIDMQPLEPTAIFAEAATPYGTEHRIANYAVWVRLGGLAKALPERMERLNAALGESLSGPAKERSLPQISTGIEEAQFWHQAREMAWVPPGYALIKVPLTPKRIPPLEAALKEGKQHCNKQVLRRYSVAGQVAWLAYPAPLDDLASLLVSQNLAGLVFFGDSANPQLGQIPGAPFLRRVKSALDPAHRFASFH